VADEDRKLATNSALIITIVAIIIYIVPVVLYSWYGFFQFLFRSYSIDDMILQYENRNYELNMKYNTLQDMYLFCTYIPSKRNKSCINDGSEEGVAIAIDNMNIKKIIKKIMNIKKGYENEYEQIKISSYTKIEENKKIREANEEKEKLLKEAQESKDRLFNKGENGKNTRFAWTSLRIWIQSFLSALNIIFNNFLNIAKLSKDIGGILVPIFSTIFGALLKNKVVMGFLIIVGLIVFLLYSFKPKSSNTGRGGSGSGFGNPNLTSSSTYSPYAIYIDVVDSYSYYKKMMSDFSNNMSESLGKNDEGNQNDGIDDDSIFKRELHDPTKTRGRYDNISNINLVEVGITKIPGLDKFEAVQDKHYNVYLPSEKFDIDGDVIKWKHDDNNVENKGEIKWKIDCSKIDTLMKSGVDAQISAFITNKDDNTKCDINVRGLNKIQNEIDGNSNSNDDETTIYTTEGIKD
jgi:hypothetical protein